ncbi:hypothetical protein K490DRAFT_61039 [Saccharata proteae CBS 121410]|uniref:F-box domain-containing protein n=1 Tax=Saccharata proteae CBS 121410 TaxID=1314787 RepID=A0A9P4I4E4_9PEZI|nr:hypothetical protein K490DRAFT_61039 [Saccharata proteae CBS 121410]
MVVENVNSGLFSLPNELLLTILNPLPTLELLPLTLVSHRLHALVLRIIHNRLAIAANHHEKDHQLLLECYHPSAKLTEPPLYCNYLGTDGLDINDAEADDADLVGRLGYLRSRYSRFRPHRRGPDAPSVARRHPAGDIPGSRTHPSSARTQHTSGGCSDDELVRQVLSLDSHELFTQLCAVINLIKTGPRHGLFRSFVEVEDGVLRVWREWLKQQSELASNSAVQAAEVEIEAGNTGKPRRQQADGEADQRILWVSQAQNVGIRFRVRERRFRRDNPILILANEDVAVSYDIEYEELFVRTSHLLIAFEGSLLQQENHSGKAVVFGSFG